MNTSTLSSINLPEVVECPTSKSYAARALILGAIKNKPVKLTNLPKAQDTKDLLSALKLLGLNIEEKTNEVKINNSFPLCEKVSDEVIILNGGEGGTTIRFLTVLLALGKNKYEIHFKGKMLERPMEELYQSLRDFNVVIDETDFGIRINGPLNLENQSILDCSRSSQFASAFELLKLNRKINIKYTNLSLSKSYFDLTKLLVKEFKERNNFIISADASSLGYFLAYGCLNQDLTISNVTKVDETQADFIFVEELLKIGVKLELDESGLSIKKTNHFIQGFDLNAKSCIDLIPTLVYVAAYLPYLSKFRNVEGLIHKESNRLRELKKILEAFNVEYKYHAVDDILEIVGKAKKQKVNELEVAQDHRMVMVASLFLKHNGGGKVKPASAVEKSFPEFFNYFN